MQELIHSDMLDYEYIFKIDSHDELSVDPEQTARMYHCILLHPPPTIRKDIQQMNCLQHCCTFLEIITVFIVTVLPLGKSADT